MTRRLPSPRALAAAAATVGLLATTLLVVRAGEDEPTYVFRGLRVSNAADLIGGADAGFRSDAYYAGATYRDASRCYFERIRPGDDIIAPRLRCGPVVHFGGTGQALWDTYRLEVGSDGKTTVQLALAATAARRGQRVDVGRLTRPDGARPGPVTGLVPPPFGRFPPGYTELRPNYSGPALRRIAGTVRMGMDFELELTGVGRADELESRQGRRRAARGERLVIVEYELGALSPAQDLRTFSLFDFGGGELLPDPFPVEVVTSQRRLAVAGTPRSHGYLVASVPRRDTELSVDVSWEDVRLRVSLSTGKRVGADPPLLYDPPSLPLSVIVPAEERAIEPPGASRYTARLGEYRVVRAELRAHSPWVGWPSRAGAAWLVIQLQGLRAPFALGTSAVALDAPRSFRAVIEDGYERAAKDLVVLGKPGNFTEVYVEVPGFMRRFTLRIEPTWTVTFPADSPVSKGQVAFAPIEIPVTLPP